MSMPDADRAALAVSAVDGLDLADLSAGERLPSYLPDVAAIARMANAYFNAQPGSPVPLPGAALPAAPVFAAEPAYASIPGVPAATPPLTPNNNPGLSALPLPAAGAAPPSIPGAALAFPGAASSNIEQLQRPEFRVPPSPTVFAAPQPTALTPQTTMGAEPDWRLLSNTLGADLSFVPRFDDILPPFGAPQRAAVPIAAGTSPAPIPPAAAASPVQNFGYSPFELTLPSLDFQAVAAQHVANVVVPPASGLRAFDPHVVRRDFPILHQDVNGRPLIWLDNAATTQKPQVVIDRLAHFYAHENSNIHRAAHTLAARSTDAYEAAREKVRRFINAPSVKDVVFVRGTTEGINFIAQAWGRRNVAKDDEIVITHLEHHANIVPWQQLAAEKGAKLRVVPVDDTGQVLLDEYEKLLNPRTRIVSLTHVSNALGTITPVQEMVAMAHRHGVPVLVDGAQAVSHMPVDVQALDADFYVFSGHKVFGPTGIGAVYGKPSQFEAMPPWQGGGNMIADVTFEKTVFQGSPERFEAGTGNIADAVGLGAALDYLSTFGMETIAAYEHDLLVYAMDGLSSIAGLRLIGTAAAKAGVISFVLDNCRTEDVGKALDREGIAVRAGHHCAQPILRRFGLEGTVRPSLAPYNTREDIDALVSAVARIQSGRGYR